MTTLKWPVQNAVSERYPGVVLESVIQGLVYLEEFSKGIATYEKLKSPTAKDDRWVGVCFFQLFEDMQALEAFYRAVAKGELGAHVNLAHLLGFLDRADEAAFELDNLDRGQLNKYDCVLLYRVKSLHEETNGNLRKALKFAEEAWRLVQGIPEFNILAPSILAQLGVLHGRVGKAQRALWYLERGVQITKGVEQLKVRLKRAIVLIALGRYMEAKADLESLNLANSDANSFASERLYLLGEVAWAVGEKESAINHYLLSIDEALTAQVTYEEFVCRIPLVVLFGASMEFKAAHEHLARAQTLISDKSDRLNFRFREILFLHWRGDYTAEHALAELQALANSFGEMGLLQEQGWVRLHVAEIYRKLGDDRFTAELDALQALSVTLQNGAFLAREWTLVPELRRIASKSHPKIAGEAPSVLEVFTLGQEKLMLGGKAVNIPLRRGVEVLAYFLENKAVSLKKLLSDIFPDEKPRSAKSYFHQFRHQLHEHIDGLEIEYDAEARLYRLKSEIDILWDVAELRAGRKVTESGLFLPSSGTEWTLLLEHSLDHFRDPERSIVDS